MNSPTASSSPPSPALVPTAADALLQLALATFDQAVDGQNGFRSRPGQRQMAERVAATFSQADLGSRRDAAAPVLGAAIVGSVIYAASTPSYAAPVVVQQQYAPPNRVAYFCSTSQQYYPNVPTCQVPWQPVNY